MSEQVVEVTKTPQTTPGSAGLSTQMPGQATTVDGLSAPEGGVGAGNLFEREVDKDLFEFEGDDTPLMSLLLNAKKIPVNSPEVDHFQIDEEKVTIATNAALAKTTTAQGILPLESNDQSLCKICDTLHVRGVNGYTDDGQTERPGVDLELYVTGVDATTNNPIVRAVNGPKTNKTDQYCTIPAIPSGTVIDILSNAMHETQKEVAPDSSIPTPTTIYLQKRGLNQIISDYFDSQKKRIPFSQALLAERAIRKFKRACNRTLWIGQKGKMPVQDPKTGMQFVYFTEGARWMFKREIQHTGTWTFEEFVAVAKMFFTGADVPSNAICLCGKNYLEGIQCIDFKNHPEVKIEVKTNALGWSVTNIHTVFGDLQFKREPTLDKIGYSNSCGIFGENRLVDYVRSAQHSDSERIEGHEASRESVILWDGLGLKGSCHLFINGEGTATATNAIAYKLWSASTAPTGDDLVSGTVYYLLVDCPGINKNAQAGETWLCTKTGETVTWSEYTAEIKV